MLRPWLLVGSNIRPEGSAARAPLGSASAPLPNTNQKRHSNLATVPSPPPTNSAHRPSAPRSTARAFTSASPSITRRAAAASGAASSSAAKPYWHRAPPRPPAKTVAPSVAAALTMASHRVVKTCARGGPAGQFMCRAPSSPPAHRLPRPADVQGVHGAIGRRHHQ